MFDEDFYEGNTVYILLRISYSEVWIIEGGSNLPDQVNNQSLFRSRDWLSASQGPVFPGLFGS